jgi:hypothetical protein
LFVLFVLFGVVFVLCCLVGFVSFSGRNDKAVGTPTSEKRRSLENNTTKLKPKKLTDVDGAKRQKARHRHLRHQAPVPRTGRDLPRKLGRAAGRVVFPPRRLSGSAAEHRQRQRHKEPNRE